MSGEGPRTSTPRVRLTPELRRLRIQTRQDYTASGRTRLASRLADNVESPFNRSTRVVRSPTPIVHTVPVGDLLAGEEFQSPLLQTGSLVFNEREASEGSDSDLGDFAGDQEQTVRPVGPEAPAGDEPGSESEEEQVEDEPEQVFPDDMAFNYREVDGLIPEFDGRPETLDRFIRGVELAMRLVHIQYRPTLLEVVLVKLTGRAQILAKEGMVYANWETLKTELKHRFRASRPTKAIRKALESLYQGPDDSVRNFALKVEDTLAEYVSSDAGGMRADQREALVRDREAQALEYGKLRDWAKARDFETLKEAVDYALSEELNIKPKARPPPLGPTGHDRPAQGNPKHGESRSNEGQGRAKGGRRRGRGGNRAPGSEGCFQCGEIGHWSRECPQNGGQIPKTEPSRPTCNYCGKYGHDVGRCHARRQAEEAGGQNVAGPSYRPQQTMQTGAPKNVSGSSASPANIRSVQVTNAQVHREPQCWNEIREAPESSGNQSG